MKSEENIILIGLMGSGKTTVGKLLAKSLNKDFFDTDHLIETKTGVDVATIFDLEGEEGFRSREANLLSQLKKKHKLIIATGGGIILRNENRKILRELGTIIYLKAYPTDLKGRLKNDTARPLIQNVNLSIKLDKLFEERNPIYESLADIVIHTKNKKIVEIINEIMELIN